MACSPKPALAHRPLLTAEQATQLAGVFKILANNIRLRLLHGLVCAGGFCVSDLATAVGVKPQAVSNQLQRLVDRGILALQRHGNNVCYRLIEPCVIMLLDQGLCLAEDAQERTP